MKRYAAACALVLLMPAQAMAQEPASSPLILALLRCRSQTDEASRLRCFDAAAATLADATAAGSVVLVDREQVRRTRRSLFGFSLPKLSFFSGDNSQEEEPDEIEGKVRSISQIGNGRLAMTLEEGGSWQTTETLARVPRVGSTVRIKKAALGGYFIIFGSRSARAMRVR